MSATIATVYTVVSSTYKKTHAQFVNSYNNTCVKCASLAMALSSKSQKKLLQYFNVEAPNARMEDSSGSTSEGADVALLVPSFGSESEEEITPRNSTASIETPECQCRCCSDRGTAHQPANVEESKVSHAYSSKTGHKKHTRMIQGNWYKSLP